MSDASLNIAKIKAYDDLKRMIRFLIEEQDAIEGIQKKREFMRKNIETIYESNFKSKISIDEFESMIFDICISKSMIMGDTNEDKIRKKVSESVLHYNIRNKTLISEKLSMALADDPRKKGQVKATVESHYKDIISPIIADMVRKLIPKKEVDSREIITLVKKERFEIDTVSISKIFSKELKAYRDKFSDQQKRELDIKRRFGGRGEDIKRDSRAPGAKSPVEKMNLIVSREKKKKEEFINALTETSFKLGETFLDDNTRVFVHTSEFKQKKIIVISYALEGDIDNVSLLFENIQSKSGEEFFFDMAEMQAVDEKVMPAFIKNKLGFFSKVLGVPRALEAIWFLSTILTVEKKLPLKTVEFLDNTFLSYLQEIETEIYKAAVQQAIKQ